MHRQLNINNNPNYLETRSFVLKHAYTIHTNTKKEESILSQSNIPNFTPNVNIDRDDAVNLLLASIAMEEMGLAHILNAEGEKVQHALKALQQQRRST